MGSTEETDSFLAALELEDALADSESGDALELLLRHRERRRSGGEAKASVSKTSTAQLLAELYSDTESEASANLTGASISSAGTTGSVRSAPTDPRSRGRRHAGRFVSAATPRDPENERRRRRSSGRTPTSTGSAPTSQTVIRRRSRWSKASMSRLARPRHRVHRSSSRAAPRAASRAASRGASRGASSRRRSKPAWRPSSPCTDGHVQQVSHSHPARGDPVPQSETSLAHPSRAVQKERDELKAVVEELHDRESRAAKLHRNVRKCLRDAQRDRRSLQRERDDALEALHALKRKFLVLQRKHATLRRRAVEAEAERDTAVATLAKVGRRNAKRGVRRKQRAPIVERSNRRTETNEVSDAAVCKAPAPSVRRRITKPMAKPTMKAAKRTTSAPSVAQTRRALRTSDAPSSRRGGAERSQKAYEQYTKLKRLYDQAYA